MAVTGFGYWCHGGLPDAISTTVHPNDHTSAFLHPFAIPAPETVSLITSGAIHSGVPFAPPSPSPPSPSSSSP
eukprot:CAMPEP_0171972924 /NCGR_PEP_ID=MMETSP0993-20121228/225143_1 /TAXON_ID=483369 /ORGANISM="non described non described, Strain CCMP2098" /LENGTH=72 /DNA_ID=CAMNT_0012623597 /DNA_START=44 /DNA_END=259 /DNA_ORIENTATION=+